MSATDKNPTSNIVVIPFQGSKLDFVKFQIIHSVPVNMNDGEATLLAYLYLYPSSAKIKFLNDGHSSSEKSVENYLSSLRRKGVVVGKGNSTAIHPDLYLSSDPSNMVFTYQITEKAADSE